MAPQSAARTLLLVLLLAVTALAGCTKAPEPGTLGEQALDEDGDGNPDSRPEHARGILPPEWDPFDHWTYTTTDGGSTTFVITGDSSSAFTMDTSDADMAFFHAREAVSLLGEIRKPDLAGSQGDDRVEFFKWPLRGGLVWNTTWDGTEKRIEAQDMGDGTFRFVATEQDGTPYAEYAYDPDVMWFTELTYKTPDGGDAFGFTLADHGEGFTGEVVRWSLTSIYGFSGGASEPATVQGGTDTFEVPEGATDVWFEATVACTQGGWAFTTAPSGQADPDAAIAIAEECPFDTTTTTSVPAVAGTWAYEHQVALDAAGTSTVELLVRTLETIPVTP